MLPVPPAALGPGPGGRSAAQSLSAGGIYVTACGFPFCNISAFQLLHAPYFYFFSFFSSVNPGEFVNVVQLVQCYPRSQGVKSPSPGWLPPCHLGSGKCLKIALLGEKPVLPGASCHVPAQVHPSPRRSSTELSHNDPPARCNTPRPGTAPAEPPPPQPRASDQARGIHRLPRPPQGPAAPSRPPRGGEASAGAARWRPRGSGGAGRRPAAPPRRRGVGLRSAAALGTVTAASGGVCVRRQRGHSAAPLRPPAPSHAVVMEEPRWRPWPTPWASGRSTTTSA